MTTEPRAGCFPKVANSWHSLLSTLTFKHPVHPLEPIAPDNSEFFLIDSKIRIRVIHVTSDNTQKQQTARQLSIDLHSSSKRSSLSEEYWFTKWNKPLKIGNCNCSFRRSLRFSLVSNKSLTVPKLEEPQMRASISSFDAAPTRIVNVDTFVERILQETLFEAFQEYYMLENRNGKVNFAFVNEESDEGEDGVVLRKKTKPTTSSTRPQKVLAECDLQNVKVAASRGSLKSVCVHKKSALKAQKPCILLFHGIGTSADIWWLVMNTLVHRGYEVVAPDMLGHGYSSAPNKASCYAFHNLLIHAITIFDHYNGVDDKRKCILIGHSYGIASALYRHRASQISQLILISGGGPTPLASLVKDNEISPFGCIHMLFRPLLFCGLKRSFLFSSRGKHFAVCDPETAIPPRILEYISQGQNWPEGDAAFHRRILVPTLLVHGLQDKHVTLVQQCEMERTIPRAFLELIPNAGHMSMLETPEHLSHMILCFLDTWS